QNVVSVAGVGLQEGLHLLCQELREPRLLPPPPLGEGEVGTVVPAGKLPPGKLRPDGASHSAHPRPDAPRPPWAACARSPRHRAARPPAAAPPRPPGRIWPPRSLPRRPCAEFAGRFR